MNRAGPVNKILSGDSINRAGPVNKIGHEVKTVHEIKTDPGVKTGPTTKQFAIFNTSWIQTYRT